MNKLDEIISLEFENLVVEIAYNNKAAFGLADLLCCDLPRCTNNKTNKTIKQYSLTVGDKGSRFSLFEGKKKLYQGHSRYDLAYKLTNTILYNCVWGNMSQHAIHSGAVSSGDYAIILPGLSGTGKSTLTAWLSKNGFGYLSDELIFLSDSGEVTPFTRPINLKTRQPLVSKEFLEKHQDQILLSEKGESMIPHRLLNHNFSARKVPVKHIIFPRYEENAKTEFRELSPAKSCLKLLQSHVNARNLPSHGISSLSNIVRQCSSYDLIYSKFDDLIDLLLESFPGALTNEKISHS